MAGGKVKDASNELTEVVEYVKTTSTPSFVPLPFKRSHAVGAMFDNAPIICGGYYPGYPGPWEFLDTCISYQDSQWIQSHTMGKKREKLAGVQINTNTFWILGGYSSSAHYVSDGSFLSSTEFIIQGKTNGIPRPELPYELRTMCAVKLSENEIFVIGGRDGNYDYRNEVWIYDPQNGFARTQGPSLSTARGYHSCSTMRDGEKTVIIAAGGEHGYQAGGYNNYELDSVEIYDPNDNTWNSGKNKILTKKILTYLVY